MAKKNQQHVFSFKNILETEINQKNWNEKKQQLQEQFGKFKVALETDLAEAEAQKILDMFNDKLNLQLNVEQFKKDAEGVKKIIETALASLNNIDTSALKKIEDTLDNIADTTGKIFNQIEKNANQAFNNIGQGAQKAAKKTIASVSKIDAELAKLGGNFTEIQGVLDFEITGSAEKQLKTLRLEQEKLNQAMAGDNWLEQQKAMVRYMKAYETYHAKVTAKNKNNEKKIPKDLSDLYHANVGKASDAETNLRHIIDRHDKKWSGDTGSGISIDTKGLAQDETLKEVRDILKAGIKVSDDGGSKESKNDKPPKDGGTPLKEPSTPKVKTYTSFRAIGKSDEFSKKDAIENYHAEYWSHDKESIEDAIKLAKTYSENFDGDVGAIIKGKIKPTNPLIFDADGNLWNAFDKIEGIVDKFPKVAEMMQQGISGGEIQNYINQEATKMGHDAVIIDNVFDSLDAQKDNLLATTIAVLNDNIVELIGAYHGEAKEVTDGKKKKMVWEFSDELKEVPDYYKGPTKTKSTTKKNVDETFTQHSTTKGGTKIDIDESTLGNAIANALKGVQLNANTQGEVKASIDATELKGVLHDGTAYDVKDVGDSNTDIVNRLDQIVTNTNNLPTSIKEALYAGELSDYKQITDADFDKIFKQYSNDEFVNQEHGTIHSKEDAMREFDVTYKNKFAKWINGFLNVYSKEDLLNKIAQDKNKELSSNVTNSSIDNSKLTNTIDKIGLYTESIDSTLDLMTQNIVDISSDIQNGVKVYVEQRQENPHMLTKDGKTILQAYRGVGGNSYGGLVSTTSLGSFSTNDPNLAQEYASGSGRVEAVNIAMKNPLVISDHGATWTSINHHDSKLTKLKNKYDDLRSRKTPENADIIDKMMDKILKQAGGSFKTNRSTDDWLKYALAQGYDGVIFEQISDHMGSSNTLADVFVTFKDDQLYVIETLDKTLKSNIGQIKNMTTGSTDVSTDGPWAKDDTVKDVIKAINGLSSGGRTESGSKKQAKQYTPPKYDKTAWQELVDDIKTYPSTKDYFDIKRGALDVYGPGSITNGELFEKLNLVDELGQPLFSTINAGFSNLGGIVSDQFTLIAREGHYLPKTQDLMPKLAAARQQGANVGDILDVFSNADGSIIYELQSTVAGKDISKSDEFLQATPKQLQKLVQDLEILHNNGLNIDFGGDNIFYDPKKGFSFIDLATKAQPGQDTVDGKVNELLKYMSGFTTTSEFNGFKEKIAKAQEKTVAKTKDVGSEGGTDLASEKTLSEIKHILETMAKEPEQEQQLKITADSIQTVLDGIKTLMPETDTDAPWATEATLANGTNKKLDEVKNALKGMVMIPEQSAKQNNNNNQPITANNVSISSATSGAGKVKVKALDENGEAVFHKEETTTTKTPNAIKTQKNVYMPGEDGELRFAFTEIIEDFDKLAKEQATEENKIKTARAKLNEFITQFRNKTQGQAEKISGFNSLSDLLNTDWNLDTIETAKQGMLALNAEFNKLTQNFRKGSSSLNPFVNAINNTEKLESQIQNIQLDFMTLKNAPEELYTTVDGLQGDFAKVMSLKDGNDIEAYSLAYGNLREKIVKVVNEIRILRKEQGIQQKSALFDEDKEVAITRSDTQVAEWEKMSYIPDELRTKFRALHNDLNNVIDKDELSIWKKEWEQIRIQITALRREHQGMEKDLKEVLTIYEEIGRNEAKIEGLQSEGEKDIYRQRNIELEKEAKELAEIYGLNVDLATIEKARADAKNAGMVKIDAAQERKNLQERIKADRKAARVNAANTKWNAGQNTLLDLWKIDDDSIDVEKIGSVKALEQALEQLAEAQKRADVAIRDNTKDAPAAIKSLKAHSQTVAELTADVKELIANYERFSGSNTKELGAFNGGDWEQQVTAAIKAKNPGAKIKSINHDLQEVTYELKTGTRAFTEYTAGIRKADKQMVAVKGTTRKLPTFFEGVRKKLGEIGQYFSAMSFISRGMQELRRGLQYVKEIDLALTELKKVTDETEQTYDKFLDTASKTAAKVGSTIRDVVSSTADWARLGYSMEQAAKFAESTQILMNVSEFTDVSQATDTLISAVQAFGYTAETSMDVVDLLNMIGNNYAVSTADLAQSLTKSSASLVAAGGNLAEAAALTATANAIVQDADAVGTALKTTSLRLRGTSVEVLEEEGVDSDGAVTSKSKLRSKVQALSGVDILTETGDYKSTYEILSQIANVWEKISDIDQAALLELLAGKRNASVLAAILQAPEQLKAAYEDANNAQGSALKENEKYLDSIQGKIDQFTNAVQTLWKNTLDDDVVKFFVELATSLVKILDKLGPIKTLIAGIAVYLNKKYNFIDFSGFFMNAKKAKAKIAELEAQKAKLGDPKSEKNRQKIDALDQEINKYKEMLKPNEDLVAAQNKLQKAQDRLANTKSTNPETIKRYEREVKKAKVEVDNLTVAHKKAGKTGNVAFKNLGKSVKNFAKSIGKVLVQMATMWAIMKLLELGAKLIDYLIETPEEAAEKFEELTNQLEATKGELEGINDELKTLDDKIAELIAKEKLSFTEQEELERLKEERAELERELELKKALAQQQQEQVNLQTSDQVKYYKDKGVNTGKTAGENVGSGAGIGAGVGAAVGVASGVGGAVLGVKAGAALGAWAGPIGMLIGAAIGAAAGAAIGAGIGGAVAASEPTVGESIDNMEENLAKKEEEVRKARDAYQKSGSDADKKKYEEAQQALNDYRGEMSKYFTELGDYYDNVDLSEVEDPERYKALKKEMNDFYNERDKWLITSGSEGATSNAIERVFDKKENKKAKEDIEALMKQLQDDPGNTAIKQEIKDIINNSETLKSDFEAIGIELDDVANSFTQMAEDKAFGTIDGKVKELERATAIFNNLLNGGQFSFEGKNIGLADLFTDEGEVVQTKLSEIFKGTSSETRAAITGLLERSYDDIQNGTVNIETLLGEFASRGSEAIIKILEETSDTFEEISENMDKIQSSYSTLSNAVEQYNSAGFLTLDNLQSLLSLEPEYLALLQMENGQLTINREGYIALVQTKLAEAKASVVQSAMKQLNALAAKKEADATNEASTAAANSISNLGTYANALSGVAKNAIGAAGAVYAFNNAVAGAQANELVKQEEIDAIINSMDTQLQMIDSVGANLSTNFGSIMTGGEGGNPKDGGEDSDKFEELLKKHQNELDAITHEKDLIQAEIDEAEAKGFIASEKYYNKLIALEQQDIAQLKAKQQALKDYYAQYSASMSTDEIDKWNAEMRTTVLAIKEADKNMIEFGNTIREIGEEYFNKVSEDIDAINEEIEFMHGLLEDEPVADENGNWSNEALTRLGLYTQQMEKAAFETQRAKDELAELQATTSEADKNTDWYREKEEELTQAIYDGVNSYNDAKDGIVELNEARVEAIKEGIEKEIEAYNDLIENKKEALDAERDLYDFKKNIEEQNKSIADTERKLAALSGSTAAEDIAERKRLEAELRKQQGDLDDTYYDHSMTAQQNALDEEGRYFEEAQQRRIESLEAMLENTEELIVNSMMDVMLNADTVHQTLNEQANTYGVTLSKELTKPWLDASAQAIAWRDELKRDMTEGEWAAMIGEGGAITAFSNGIATKLGGSWDTVKTKAKAYSDFLTGTELKNNLSGAVTTFTTYLQKIVDKWNEIRNAAVAATAVTPTVPSGGTGGGSGGNPTPSPSPTPTPKEESKVKLRGLMQTSREMILGSKNFVDANTETINGVKYYRDSNTGYYYKISDLNSNRKYDGGRTTGWAIPKGTWFYTKHAKGTLGTTKDEWALTDELGPELTMYATPDGTLSFMRAGSTVIPAELTKELMDIGAVGLNGLMKPKFDSGVNVINNAINKPEYNFNIEALVKADHIDQNSIKDVEKMVSKQLDEFTRKLNYSLKGIGGR